MEGRFDPQQQDHSLREQAEQVTIGEEIERKEIENDYVVIRSPNNGYHFSDSLESYRPMLENLMKKADDINAIKALIEQSIKMTEIINKQGERILKLQIEKEVADAKLEELENEIKILEKRNDLHHALITHAKEGNLPAASRLVEICGTAEVCDEEGITALHWSVLNNHVEIAEYLAEHGAMWQTRNAKQETIFTMLSREPNTQSLIMAIKHYPPSELCDELANAYHLFTEPSFKAYIAGQLLIHVCRLNQQNYLGFALSKNENVNVTDNVGNMPLHYACLASNRECVTQLLEKNADTDARDANQRKPDELTSDENIKCLINQYRLLQAVNEGNLEKVNEWSPLPNTNINEIKDKSGMSSLHLAVQSGRKNIVEALLQKGMGSHVKNNTGKTPIHLAIEQNETKILKLVVTGAEKLTKEELNDICKQYEGNDLRNQVLYFFGKRRGKEKTMQAFKKVAAELSEGKSQSIEAVVKQGM